MSKEAQKKRKASLRNKIGVSIVAAFVLFFVTLIGVVYYSDMHDPATIASNAALEKVDNIGAFDASEVIRVIPKKSSGDYNVFWVSIHERTELARSRLGAPAKLDCYVVMKGRTVVEIVNSDSIEIKSLLKKYGME